MTRFEPAAGASSSRRWFAVALLAEILGATAALLAAGRVWQSITIARPLPLPAATLAVSGRTLDASITAVAIVALAGVVGILATRGLARRLVGFAVMASGFLILGRSVSGAVGVSASRAYSLVSSHKTANGLDPTTHPSVRVHSIWPVLAASGGALVAVAGMLVFIFGGAWSGMSARYEAPKAADAAPDDVALWTALDRGDDPTADSES